MLQVILYLQCYLIGSLLCDRLNKWKPGVDGILDLWQAAGALQLGSSAQSFATSAESLEKGNIRRALRWASDGHYGNALCALGSGGVASYNNVATRDDLIHRHPQNVVPSRSSDVPVSLVVEPSVVLYALRSFPFPRKPLLVAQLSVLSIYWMLCAVQLHQLLLNVCPT